MRTCIQSNHVLTFQRGAVSFLILCMAISAQAATVPPIQFVSPGGGELYIAGQQETVRLDPKTRAKSVLIELSYDSGATFVTLGTINNMVKDKTKLNMLAFTVSGPGSSQCKIRATAGTSTGLSGEFSISVNPPGVLPGSVGMLELADGSVTNPKLAELAVTADKISSDQSSPKMVLTADGNGNAIWASVDASGLIGVLAPANLPSSGVTAGSYKRANITVDATGRVTAAANGNSVDLTAEVTGVLPLANGGTGSASKNFVDLSTNQAGIAGNKTFAGTVAVTNTFVVEPRPNNAAAGNFFAGVGAGAADTTGANNTFIGQNAGNANVNATGNTFVGFGAGALNTAGNNTFFGRSAGAVNTSASNNTFVGSNAGAATTTGASNTFVGQGAGPANTTGSNNAFFGVAAGTANIGGTNNTFLGTQAGQNNTVGGSNTFVGQGAGQSNTSAANNAFFGTGSGFTNTSGNNNSFFGTFSGNSNGLGSNNAFFGMSAGQSNTSGVANTFVGSGTGINNTSGGNNTFVGQGTGVFNTIGQQNTFAGVNAGAANVTGSNNVFFGFDAGQSNTGSANTFVGPSAGAFNTSGINNSFYGSNAGLTNTASGNTFVGANSAPNNTSGTGNVFVGLSAGNLTTAENNCTAIGSNAATAAGVTNATAIGANAVANTSNSVILGDASCAVGIKVANPVDELEIGGNGTIVLSSRNSDPATPTGTNWKVYIYDSGTGVRQLRIKGSSGTVNTIFTLVP